MKKIGAATIALAVTASMAAAPQAQAAEAQGSLTCDRLVFRTNGTTEGQKPTTLKVDVDAPETVTAGEEYNVTFKFGDTDKVVKKSAFQATQALELDNGATVDSQYVQRQLFANIGDDQVIQDLADTEWVTDTTVKVEVPGQVTFTKVAGTPGEETIGTLSASFVEVARVNAEAEAKPISRWSCTFTPAGENFGTVTVEEAEEEQQPAAPEQKSGLAKLLGLFAGLAGLFALLLPLLQGQFNEVFGSIAGLKNDR